MASERFALVTVTSDSFLPGTLTMIESFRATNSWFEGDVIVIHQLLSAHARSTLLAFDPRLIHKEVPANLSQLMVEVANRARWKTGKELQFASIAAFDMPGYDRVIFCDSDLLFVDSIQEIVALDAPLVACGDGAFYRGNQRRRADFIELEGASIGATAPCMDKTFNSGLMIIDTGLVTTSDYEGLITSFVPSRWADDCTGHTDQMIINVHFSGRQRLVSPIFNFLLSHRALIRNKTGFSAANAKVLHFTGRQKPWLPFETLSAHGIDEELFAAFSAWNGVHTDLCRRYGIVAADSR